jgi:hypothetical protein
MKRNLLFVGILALVGLLVWSASKGSGASPFAPTNARLSPTPAETLVPPLPCEVCAQATLAAALTQEQVNLSALQAQATATADILGANTLATSNAAASTQGVALTQEKVNANALQAQAAATADILRAHTLATSNAAASTQSVLQTQEKLDANVLQAQVTAAADILQANALATSNAAVATQSAAQTEAVLQQFRLQLTSGAAAQQRIDKMVFGTATAIAGIAALQAQSNAAQRQEPIPLLWMWVAPIFILVAVVLSLWGLSRWLAQRRNAGQPEGPVVRSNPPPMIMNNPPPVIMSILPPPDELPQPGGEVVPGRYQLTKPDSHQVRGWLEEVKHKLLSQRRG